MPDQNTRSNDDSRKEEAKHLAEEAVEEMKQGNKEEGQFVLNEAKKLDADAVGEVLHQANPSGGKKGG
jgi:biopolymer transport protein ExbD